MGCIASFLGGCCATCGCECLKCLTPDVSKGSRVPYVLLMFLSTAVACILRYWGKPFLIHLVITNIVICDSDRCYGFGAVYRISFALFLWFLIHALMMLSTSCYKADSNYWSVRILMYIGILILTWFIPDQFFDVYVHISRVVGGIFLLLQIVILIDFAYRWNEDWTSDEKDWKCGVLSVALLFYAGCLVLIVFMFLWFGGEGCGVQKFILSFTVISTFIYTLLSVSNFVDKGGILPPSVLALYCHFLCFNALSSDPTECNTMKGSDQVHLWLGLIIGAASISYAAWNLANSNSLFGGHGNSTEEVDNDHDHPIHNDTLNHKLMANKEQEEELHQAASASAPAPATAKPVEGVAADVEKGKTTKTSVKGGDGMSVAEALGEEESAPSGEQQTQKSKFHFVMACSAMYMAMILTNWSSRNEPTESSAYDLGVETMWIKIVSQWLTILLFIWTLIAPRLCVDRDFN